MSSLTYLEKRKLESLLGMGGGYVLDFSDRTFGEFFRDSAKVNIYSEKYSANGSSKANHLRAFWEIEPDIIVGRVLSELLGVWAHAKLGCAESEIADAEMRRAHDDCRTIVDRLLHSSGAGTLQEIGNLAVVFDAKHLVDQVQRMRDAVDNDPALAIGTAKELIETCCKTILAERGKPVTGTPDIPTLTKRTLKELKLVPEGIPEQTRGSDVIKRLLRNLGTIGNDLAELRGLYGTGHGKHGKAKGLTPRHARLAVGATATLAMFLFETHMEAS